MKYQLPSQSGKIVFADFESWLYGLILREYHIYGLVQDCSNSICQHTGVTAVLH